jgi:uncharacterized membrane protein YphA (DoxX/SURF4 family)
MLDLMFPNLASRHARWAPLLLRLIVGYGFMVHGVAKLARGPQHFANILAALGVPFPELLSWATILLEVFGGAAFLLGALVTLVSTVASGAAGCNRYCTSPQRIQLHQTAGGGRGRRAFWSARL